MTITNQRLLTQGIVLARMTSGTRYSLHQLARLVGAGMPTMQRVLAECIVRGVVKKSIAGKRDVYWLPAADELPSSQGGRSASLRETMQAYDAGNCRFRDLCLATRTGGKTI
ncbi:hypothetical protein R75461_07222 [Paraburkholderia nemoris]|nr:hypothetical protein R75461_07222 [Paraburkholderia nemoris]